MSGRGGNIEFTLDDQSVFREVEENLRHYLRGSRGWFDGGQVAVNVGRRLLSFEELGRLRRVFEDEFQIKVARFWCAVDTLASSISEQVGVPVDLLTGQSAPPLDGEVSRLQERALFVRGTCRSGTTIHHNGDVIVLGDVNPGAEVTASGDIIVIGTLRGIAHAGANITDASDSAIIALSLHPIQLRIGPHVSVAPDGGEGRSTLAHPEIAYVSGGSIVVAPFTGRLQTKQERNVP